jgi:O-antigen ligase
VLVFIVLGLVFFIGADQWLARSLGLQIQEDVSGGRFHFWYIAWRIFLDHPILGTGLDSFATMFQQYDTWNGRFRVERAHNEYLQTLSDSGIIGFVCVSAFIYLLFKRGLRVISCERDDLFRGIAIGALAGCLGVLIHSFFDFPLRTNSNAFYFLLLAALASEPVEHSSRMEISGGH